ncbi:hypothetical protein E2C01_082016 [Portunus trituberculatus]|uniref:Uncharacterized protein n=1 Tax=Portunus trituberculatus TaxID=210409 RepID=A0A5B7J3V0_PORTR|nr:hypothetical protein [Portunus trituberculatus]
MSQSEVERERMSRLRGGCHEGWMGGRESQRDAARMSVSSGKATDLTAIPNECVCWGMMMLRHFHTTSAQCHHSPSWQLRTSQTPLEAPDRLTSGENSQQIKRLEDVTRRLSFLNANHSNLSTPFPSHDSLYFTPKRQVWRPVACRISFNTGKESFKNIFLASLHKISENVRR